MNMIRHSIDNPAGAAQFKQLLVNEVVEFCVQWRREQRFAVFGGENGMRPEFGVYVAHEELVSAFS